MPLSWALAVGRGIGFLVGGVLRHRRRYVLETMERCLPEKTPTERRMIVRAMYRNFGMNLVESLRLAAGCATQLDGFVTVDKKEIVSNALSRGKGVLMLTAHLGNWDLLSVMTPKWSLPTLTIISKDVKNQAVNDFWMGMRDKFGLNIVPAHNSYRACRATLKKNGLVGFVLDQNMIASEGIFVDFFGRPACTTPGLAFMSAQSQAPVVPVFIRRTEAGKHEAWVLPVIEPPPDREPETIRKFTQQYSRVIEDVIREYPEEWIWIHKRWRTKPPVDRAGE